VLWLLWLLLFLVRQGWALNGHGQLLIEMMRSERPCVATGSTTKRRATSVLSSPYVVEIVVLPRHFSAEATEWDFPKYLTEPISV
jgi:hypothetical protein